MLLERKNNFVPTEKPSFTFIDLFAGIGGFRIAMQEVGGLCVFSSEWDKDAKKTYFHNFNEVPYGDITDPLIKGYIPTQFDVLCAGFPCQAFSVAGYRRGFEDTRGTLFFDIAEIVSKHKPKIVFLENVKNLYSHDKGRTFKVIKRTLEDLGYSVKHKVMNSMEYSNIPQNRERIFIIAIDPQQVIDHNQFLFPSKIPLTRTIHDCIDYSTEIPSLYYTPERMKHYDKLKEEIISENTVYQWRRQYVRANKSNLCPTLTANMGTGGHNVPIILTPKGIRKLSPRECLNFQGFPINFEFPYDISMSAMYKQVGNSVVVPLVYRICKEIVRILFQNSKQRCEKTENISRCLL